LRGVLRLGGKGEAGVVRTSPRLEGGGSWGALTPTRRRPNASEKLTSAKASRAGSGADGPSWSLLWMRRGKGRGGGGQGAEKGGGRRVGEDRAFCRDLPFFGWSSQTRQRVRARPWFSTHRKAPAGLKATRGAARGARAGGARGSRPTTSIAFLEDADLCVCPFFLFRNPVCGNRD